MKMNLGEYNSFIYALQGYNQKQKEAIERSKGNGREGANMF